MQQLAVSASYDALDGYLQRQTSGGEVAAVPIPIADEPHVATWRAYLDEAADGDIAAVLQACLPQLRFPIAGGMSTDPDYRAAVRSIDAPLPADPPPFDDPAGIRLTLQPTAAGTVPVLTIASRSDFERLVRALGARNEPVPVPAGMGACIVGGMVNRDRVARHRRQFLASGMPASAWTDEYRVFVADKRNYQDRVVLLSEGPYAGVAAERLGLAPDDWRKRSSVLRRVHECTHYLTARALGSMRNNLLDELAADYAGIVAAFGRYDAQLARIVLGVDDEHPSDTARLRLYLGEPPLDEALLPLLAALARDAIAALARFDLAEAPAAQPLGVEHAVLALFETPLASLVQASGEQRLRERYRRRIG